MRRRNPFFTTNAAIAVGVLGVIYAVAYVILCLRHELQPFSLLNLLLSAGVAVICAQAVVRRASDAFSMGALLLIAANIFCGQRLAPTLLTNGAVLLTGLLALYVGLKLDEHLSRCHLFVFVVGYLVLFGLFVMTLPNAEPIFILSLLGLAATARNLRLTAFFWVAVVSFTFCQPYAWESLLIFSLFLAALLGATGAFRSKTLLVFLGGGLILVFSLLFPILIIMVGQDLHSLLLLLRDPRICSAIGLTLVTACVSTLILMLGITPLAYAMSRLRFPGRTLLLSLIDLPIVIPQSAAGIALLCVLGRKQYLGGLLGSQFGLYFDGTVLGICVAQLFVAMPFMAKSALAAFDALDVDLETMASTLGASNWSVFTRVALPLASRGLAIGAVLAFARAAGEFGALLFLAPTPETAPIAVFNRFNSMGMVEVAPLVSLLLLLSLGMFLLLQLATRLLPSVEGKSTNR